MRSLGKSACVAGAVFSVLIACSGSEVHDHDNLREDVLYCEEALSALKACCPNFDARSISCEYSYDYVPTTSCAVDNSQTIIKLPDFGLAESQCLLNTTCGALKARGACAHERCQ